MANKESKVYIFAWEGTNARREKVKGEMESEDINLVRARLREQGVTPRRIHKKSSLAIRLGGGINARDITIFSRQLATMIKAGVPIVQAFSICIEGQTKPALRKMMVDIRDQISAGTPVAQALRRHPKVFDELFCSLVEAGENSGSLEVMLERVATYKERMESLKNKIKKALYYPIFVMIIGLVVSALLLVKVVPEFESMFASFGAELPAFTQLVLNISRFMQDWWYLVFGALLAAVYSVLWLRKRSEAFDYRLTKLFLRLPIMGELLHKSAVARFSRTLATAFAAGVTLVDSLDSAGNSAGNLVYKRQVDKMKDDVSTGQQLHFTMRNGKLFPTMVNQMVAIGEESGALDTMLTKVADFYEEEVNTMVDSMTSLLEPLVIAVLGIIVGSLVIAMYLPIFMMGDIL
ncbi:type II secretion system F family protein [Marinospirillum alkaliphilum]|uniref:Type IV pilus assembly protein PilC n=1 Tax=Marinospirillum alkaliphilum DSM 21637 TaxID=1122209 RepID=A0A1K1TVC7_9GAMM|nr:type II secretion system F family protein [Marinospirillum alkaliphilum]SFX04181.1 type IV pilus assembly protein PilC [Marinospirillum alkaliphilum DSM 21637]